MRRPRPSRLKVGMCRQGLCSSATRTAAFRQQCAAPRQLLPDRRRCSAFTAQRSHRRRSGQCRAEADEHDAESQPAASAAAEKQPPYTLLLALAAGGMAETAYLAVSKVLSAPVACPLSGGCDTVLSSGYAELFGIPLSAFGFATYSMAALISFLGLRKQLRLGPARVGLMATATVLASTSAVLLYILFTEFPGDSCTWCFTSAALSFGILGSTLSSFSAREAQEVAGPSLGLAAGVLAFFGVAFSGVESSQAGFDLDYRLPTVTRSSPPGAPDLAKRLKDAGAKMYGAFWCTHCHDQKEDFGKEAMADFPYIECYPDGVHQNTKLAAECTAAGLQSFPTWIIGDQKLEGEQSLDKLQSLLPP